MLSDLTYGRLTAAWVAAKELREIHPSTFNRAKQMAMFLYETLESAQDPAFNRTPDLTFPTERLELSVIYPHLPQPAHNELRYALINCGVIFENMTVIGYNSSINASTIKKDSSFS